jgi:hypothetical protein
MYPYKKYYLDIDNLVEKAKKFALSIHGNYNLPKSLKLKDKLFYIVTDYKNTDINEINNITDYFTEECRVKTCRREHKELTPYEFFIKNRDYIYRVLDSEEPEKINKYIEQKYSPCSNYKLTYLLKILQHFKPKRWLDMSAGWGDRLCAAYLSGVEEYYGIDPSDCLHPYYQEIVKWFSERGYNTKVTLVKDRAEKSFDFKESFDFIFTSPPFFTYELYDEQNQLQSTNMYKNIDSWLNNFLFKTIDIAWEALENNGVYALYIEEKPQYPFIDKLKKYMLSKSGCKYEGIIYQIYKDERYVKRPYDVHTVYVWRKEASGDQRSLCSLRSEASGELCSLYESLDSSHVIGYGYSSIVKKASLSGASLADTEGVKKASPVPLALSDTLYHRSDCIALRDQGSPVPLALKKVFLSKENLEKKKNELYINQTLNTNPKYAALKKHVVPFYDYEFCKNDSDIVALRDQGSPAPKALSDVKHHRSDYVALIMSFKYEPNSLYSYILEKIDKNSFTEKDKSFIFSRVVNLIKLFSSYGVYHKDLHLQNIAIGSFASSSLNDSRRRVKDSLNASRRGTKGPLMFFDWGKAVITEKSSLRREGSLIKKFKETYEADIKFMKFMKSINFDFDKAMEYLKRKGVYDEYIHGVEKEIRFFRTQTYKSEELLKEIEYMSRVWMFKRFL